MSTAVHTEKVPVTKQFVLGGKAIFTVHNASGKHYTFRIKKVDPKPGSKYGTTYFTSLLTGPDNTSCWTYVGITDQDTGIFRTTRQSQVTTSTPAIQVLQWALSMIWTQREFPAGYGCHSEGKCARCGRRLTDEPGVNPEGARYGFGPKCWSVITGAKK